MESRTVFDIGRRLLFLVHTRTRTAHHHLSLMHKRERKAGISRRALLHFSSSPPSFGPGLDCDVEDGKGSAWLRLDGRYARHGSAKKLKRKREIVDTGNLTDGTQL